MTVLHDLYPGVRYNCSIGASNIAGQSPLVYADGRTMEIGRSIACSPTFHHNYNIKKHKKYNER